MNYKAEYNHELGIASLEHPESGMRILTLLQRPGVKQSAINAYLGARYSRSRDSVAHIAQEIADAGVDAPKRLETIFHGYGHASVADLSNLFVCIENVPMLTAMRFFYLNPVLAGQETSSRYIDFGNADWRSLMEHIEPQRFIDNPELYALVNKYLELMGKQVDDYLDLLTPTTEALSNHFGITGGASKSELNTLKARSLDVARHLLPIGLYTNFGAVMSARAWSEYISQMRGSSQVVEQELGELLYSLLTGTPELGVLGYVPEADGLIRYADANGSREETTYMLMDLISQSQAEDTMTPLETGVRINEVPNGMLTPIIHAIMLLDPLEVFQYEFYSKELLEEAGRIFFENHNHHNQGGNLFQSGAICMKGSTDLGSLKDFNRHRSLERFIPLLDNCISMDAELNREEDLCFEVCNYLNQPALFGLRKQYRDRLKETYKQIKAWYTKAKVVLGEGIAREYVRYLLPHAHLTAYRMYGSVDDLAYVTQLRVRSGGHINYRQLAYEWMKALAAQNPFWQPLLDKTTAPDCVSREQFLDRS